MCTGSPALLSFIFHYHKINFNFEINSFKSNLNLIIQINGVELSTKISHVKIYPEELSKKCEPWGFATAVRDPVPFIKSLKL